MLRRLRPVPLVVAVVLLALFGQVAGVFAPRFAAAQGATPVATSPVPAEGDFAGLVDIGGRKLYLECHGSGGPTVIFLSGYRTSARYWTDDLLHPDAPRQMVLPAVAQTTRVCAYDRPGTYAAIGDDVMPSRSDPVDQPRTAVEMVAELHALLQAAGIPGPYVLAAHSLGGFFARLYAATYPDEVVGLVLVDAYSEFIEDLMPPDTFAALRKVNQAAGTDDVLEIPGYGPVETFPWGADNATVRAAVAASPLRPMPLAVLAHGKSFPLPDGSPLTSEELEPLLLKANQAQAALVPDSRFFIASDSGHDIHQDQPALVAEAIRQVVAGVRSPDTWYDLSACCQP